MPPIKVEVAEAIVDSRSKNINVATQVEAINTAVIQPRIEGFLEKIHFEGGMPVRRGEVLFTIDPSTYATTLYSSRANLESAKASEVLAERNYQRAIPLASIDAISQSDLDQYRTSYKAAVAATKSAEESLRSAELQIGYTTIYAPISGIATKCTASRGDLVGPATLQNQLTTISQTDTVIAKIAIPTEKYMRYVATSGGESYDNTTLLSEIEMRLPDSTRYSYAGEYYYTLEGSPSSTSTVVIVAKFPNPQLQLKAGTFARIRANIGEPHPLTLIPKSAVSQMQGINSTWVIMADSTAEWRKIELGESYADMWAVESGITAGERVVTSGAQKLHNGVKVSLRSTKK